MVRKAFSLEGRTESGQSNGCTLAFGACFALFALVFIAIGSVYPWIAGRATYEWTEVPCTVLETGRDRSDSSYFFTVRYEYEFDGERHESGQFMAGTPFGRSLKQVQEFEARWPAGEESVCWVDPEDPTEAVLQQGSGSSWLFLIVPLIFLCVGVGIMIASRVSRRRRAEQAVEGILPSKDSRTLAHSSGIELEVPPHAAGLRFDAKYDTERPAVSAGARRRKAGFAVVLVFTLVWNGIIGFFLIGDVIRNQSIGLGLFAVPFVLVGLFLIGATVWTFLQLFNPRIDVLFRRIAVEPGDTLDFEWASHSSTSRLARLEIRLVGEEEAIYRRGTDTVTAREAFHDELVVETEDPTRFDFGKATCRVPADAMHTLQLKHGRVLWKLVVEGDARRWPDIKDEHPFLVLPHDSKEVTFR